MDVIEELVNALIREKRRLASTETLKMPLSSTALTARERVATAPSFRMSEITAMLRVEVNHEIEQEIMRYNFQHGYAEPNASIEPKTFMGVSVYLVHHPLPDCGWRIINPMSARP